MYDQSSENYCGDNFEGCMDNRTRHQKREDQFPINPTIVKSEVKDNIKYLIEMTSNGTIISISSKEIKE